jgi:hypothetical protein
MSKSTAFHVTIVVVDVDRFADPRRTSNAQLAIRRGLYGVLESAFELAGIMLQGCRTEDRGDGVMILAPSDIPRANFVERLPSAIVHGLTRHNAIHPPEEQIRLRMALHAGEVSSDAYGTSGTPINMAFRLLEAPRLRVALDTSPGVLGLITSSWFFNEVVADNPVAKPRTYRRVGVSVKETTTEAWICLPDVLYPPDQALGEEPVDFVVSYAVPDRRSAESISRQLNEAGYSVEFDEWDLPFGANFAERLADSLRKGDRLILVVSPQLVRIIRTMSESAVGLGVRVIPVEVEAIAGPRPEGTVDLVGVGHEAARLRLLAAIADRYEPEPPTPPWSGDGLPVLLVHSMPDLGFAVELSDALRGLVTERVLSSVDRRPVGELDEETEKFVDPRTRRAPGIVLLLVTRELLASGYGGGVEIRGLLPRHRARRITVRPVIVKPTSWEKQPYGKLAALPTDGVPVSQWASRDDAIRSIVDGVRLAAREMLTDEAAPVSRSESQAVQELGAVFKPAGIPIATFVEPDDFVEFKMALRQPGLGVVLEGPSGIGKTTLLRHAVKQDADRLGDVAMLSARRPADIPKIRKLLDGHEGLVAVDDFHRLPGDLQHQLSDYLKLLADDDSGAPGKLTLVGIPGTAQSLVDLAPDVATRIRVFKLGRVAETLLLQMMEKGEAALNITLDGKTDIAMASAGSLLTAQMLCWHLAMMAGIERTVDTTVVVPTDIGRARKKVTDKLRLKYEQMVNDFIVMDDPTEPLCIDLLLALAEQPDGILRLKPVSDEEPGLREAIDRVFVQGLPNGLTEKIADHLHYDPRGHRLIADDPQLVFYLRQLSRELLLDIAGKQLPLPRDQIFVCYCRKDADWLDRVQVHLRPLERRGVIDVWSDRRIEAGDMWRKEISAALARARVALLLISADFFASDFIHSEELPSLLVAAEQGGCRVIPLLVRPSMVKKIPEIARFDSMPSGTTLSEMPRERAERVLVDLARSLSH